MYRRQHREQVDRDTILAWQIAALSRQKKLPKLQTLLARRDANAKPVKQTPAQMKSVLMGLGYKTQPLSPEAKKASRIVN